MSFKVRLTIEYDGSRYFGWQFQGPDKPTIQHVLEDALAALFLEKIILITSGRTDKGVHAINQIAHFVTTKDPRRYNLVYALQCRVPDDIVVKKAELVSDEFHAQHCAVSKNYIYRIWNHPLPSALYARRALWVRKPLDLDRLNAAAQMLVGTHDFNCFRSEGTPVPTTIRTVNSAKFLKSGDFVEFHINGSGFLKQMVRNIVGTLLQIEIGSRNPDSIPLLIASRDRKLAGPTAEPQGLYLERVFYPPNLDNSAQPL